VNRSTTVAFDVGETLVESSRAGVIRSTACHPGEPRSGLIRDLVEKWS
jgi:hypothetical protein